MNENDYDRLQYGMLLFTFVVVAQFLLIVWYFQISVGYEFMIFILSLLIVGFFTALFLQYKKLAYIGQMRHYLKISLHVKKVPLKKKERRK